MLEWLSRMLRRSGRDEGEQRRSVLLPEELPRDEEEIIWRFGSEVTILLTRKRILLTDSRYTTEHLSIPLRDVVHLEPTAAKIRLRYRGPDGREHIEAFRLSHCEDEPESDDRSHEWWAESVAEVILEETGHFVLDDEDDVWKGAERIPTPVRRPRGERRDGPRTPRRLRSVRFLPLTD